MKHLSILLIVFFSISCIDKSNYSATSTQKMENDSIGTIYIPDSLKLINGDFASPLNNLKMIVYINDTCGLCVKKLFQWNNIITENKLSECADIKFITYTDQKETLKYYLELDTFNS